MRPGPPRSSGLLFSHFFVRFLAPEIIHSLKEILSPSLRSASAGFKCDVRNHPFDLPFDRDLHIMHPVRATSPTEGTPVNLRCRALTLFIRLTKFSRRRRPSDRIICKLSLIVYKLFYQTGSQQHSLSASESYGQIGIVGVQVGFHRVSFLSGYCIFGIYPRNVTEIPESRLIVLPLRRYLGTWLTRTCRTSRTDKQAYRK
jgi:hypothetical protein